MVSHVLQLQMELMKIRVIFPDGSLHEIDDRAKPVRASDVISILKQQINPNYDHNSNSKPNSELASYIHVDDFDENLQDSMIWMKRLLINPNPNNWLVCVSTSLQVGKRPCPLVPGARLQPGKLYFLLPARAFQYRLAVSHVSTLFSAAEQAIAEQRRQNGSRPVHTRKFAIQLSSKLLPRRTTRRNSRNAGSLAYAAAEFMYYCAHFGGVHSFDILAGACPEARGRYVEQLITRSNSWTPSLDTIHERCL